MPASLLMDPERGQEFAELMRPEPLEGGIVPEERMILCGLGWDRYLALDKAFGEDRPGPRFYYLDADLEIMSTSEEHERIKKWLADCLAIYFDETGTEVVPRGQATMRILKAAGAEPDESWCLGEAKQWPDIVLEIALSSGGLRKLDIYQRFAVSEVWIWRQGKLEIHAFRADGSGYEFLGASRLLPGLPIQLLERCVGISSWLAARRTFRAGLSSAS